MHRVSRLFLGAALTVGLMVGGAEGQNASKSSAKTSSTAAAKDPTPIPLAANVSQTQEEVKRLWAQVLTLQSRVAEQETRVSAASASIQQARRENVDHLFLQTSPPIWSAAASSREGKSLAGASFTV
jgi:peptidoglycan hydrolase CwlO-like protein